jgi:hypothetical protein
MHSNKQAIPQEFLPHSKREEYSSIFGFTHNMAHLPCVCVCVCVCKKKGGGGSMNLLSTGFMVMTRLTQNRIINQKYPCITQNKR